MTCLGGAGLAYDPEVCILCGACATSCPCMAIVVTKEGLTHKDEECCLCFGCLDACPVGALTEEKAGHPNIICI